GKIYVYGSRDESPKYYCSWDYAVLLSSDLRTWEVAKDAFASKGPRDQVPYSDELLYAPDCQYRNGLYYLYYCLDSDANIEGVATSESPTGPFTGGRVIDLKGWNQIDPAVFIDDDGQAYYIWGQFTAKMARLKPDMTEIDPATIRDNVLTEKEHFFHEGGTMVKRNGLYYFVYAHMGRGNRPTSIGYATSRSPMGPFTYGGVIIDNDHCDPGNWNNHGSLVEMNGRWYVFYHRATHGSKTMRKACVESITFGEDGTIDEVEMTSQGAGPPLEAREPIEAERACLLYGNVRVQAFGAANEELAGLRDDDRAGYKYIDFGEGVDSVTVRVAPGASPGRIILALDQMWAGPSATIDVPGGGDGRTWIEVTDAVKPVRGVHALWLRFRGEGDDLFKVDSFRFGSGRT
ncbi:MAG: family 43 glycosylhydrolase, partial [Candidatus Aminicenantes bacterium]|nr:family 43 glycosylhydrolase [Candidatus Aminicenantes bacterium]